MDFDRVDLRLAWTDEPPAWGGAVMMQCPRRDKHRKNDRTASLAIYPDNLHCFSCGFHVSRYRIYAALAVVLGWWDGRGSDEGHWQRAREIIERYTIDHVDAYREQGKARAMQEPMNGKVAELYAKTLWGRRAGRLDWLRARGLSDDTIKDAMIGHNGGWFTLPVYDREGSLLTIRFRRDDAYSEYTDEGKDTRPKYKGTAGRNGTFLYGVNSLPTNPPIIYAVEGELDALILQQHGLPAVSVTNGAGQVKAIPHLLAQAGVHPRHIRICTDQDAAGDDAAVEVSLNCEDLGLDWSRGVWYTGKDVTEYLLHGGDIGRIEYGQYWCIRRDTPRPHHLGGEDGGEDAGLCLDSFGESLRW